MRTVSPGEDLMGMSERAESSDISMDSGACDLLRDSLAHLHHSIKQQAARDLRECRYSREHVAERLSWLLGRSITLAQIDAVTAATKAHRFPAEWIPAWIMTTGSRRILELLCGAAGLWAADETDQRFARLGREAIKARKAAKRAAELESELWDRA